MKLAGSSCSRAERANDRLKPSRALVDRLALAALAALFALATLAALSSAGFGPSGADKTEAHPAREQCLHHLLAHAAHRGGGAGVSAHRTAVLCPATWLGSGLGCAFGSGSRSGFGFGFGFGFGLAHRRPVPSNPRQTPPPRPRAHSS